MLMFRAELSTAVGGVVGVIEADTIESLRKAIGVEWLPLLQDGDSVRIFEHYVD